MLCQTPDVGSGAPNSIIQQAFVNAWGRNGFNSLVGLPNGNVVKYGSTGLIQQFPSVANSKDTLALVKPDTTTNFNVMQVQAAMFALYGSIGVGTAGYPTTDTQNCPPLTLTPTDSCRWQPFSSNYVMFTFASGGAFATRDPFYTKWTSAGGISGGFGPATSAETAVISSFNTQATEQLFTGGAMYNVTSGLLSGRLITVQGAGYTFYVSTGAESGPLGLPTGQELVLPNGQFQQTFEGGAIVRDPASGQVTLRPAVSSISLSLQGALHLNLGDSVTVGATVTAADGSRPTDRAVGWNTSNGRVVSIQAKGQQAVLKATGAGTAVVTASAEGKSSPSLTISVAAPCCQIGEGAPTAAVQQAFLDAVARNQLSLQLPAAASVVRIGNGYVQQLLGTGSSPATYLIATEDGSVTAYVVTGALLTQYELLGGPAGRLGYPISDATAGGRQTFEGGTLAGNPPQMVSGAILTEWAKLGYESGAAGSPTGATTSFQTFRGTAGDMQAFQNAVIVAPATGPAFAVVGSILAKYLALNGPGGDLGAPTDDEHASGNLQQQDFEGGSLSYPRGSTTVTVTTAPRVPAVIATPGSVVAGSSVHLVAAGFANGATLRVSQTGQPEFTVQAPTGAYTWDVQLPSSSTGGAVTVKAVDSTTNATAQVTYTVLSQAAAPLSISNFSGDFQTGAPGAHLPQPLVVVVTDPNGAPVANQVVNFTASPGGQVTPASATTGPDGLASTMFRLPASGGVALVAAQAAHDVTTFSARAAAYSLGNFPALTQAVDGLLGNGQDPIRQKGALLASTASILRYFQSRGQLPQPNGLADVSGLNQFLRSFCAADSQGNQICDGFVSVGPEQTVNLWRAGAFAANQVDIRVEPTDLNTVRDLLASGYPVLLALSLNNLGSHFVVATGIDNSGGILISDPNPDFGQITLNAYLNGFSAAGTTIRGTVQGVVLMLPQAPATPGFLVAANAPTAISSVAGPCSPTLAIPATSAGMGVIYFAGCNSGTGPYESDITASAPYTALFTDLSPSGSRTDISAGSGASFQIVKAGSQWSISPLSTSISAVISAASATGGLAPGGLISIFGIGFGSAPTVQVGGKAATVVGSTPFQVNAQIPFDVPAGPANLTVASASGTAQQSITVSPVAPAIFVIAPGQAAITNVDNTLNTPSNPALRGGWLVIYATGLGTVSGSGTVLPAVTPVSVVIGGVTVPAAFAGLSPGTAGLDQVNVQLPANLPPGLSLSLTLKQGATVSNTVSVAIQ